MVYKSWKVLRKLLPLHWQQLLCNSQETSSFSCLGNDEWAERTSHVHHQVICWEAPWSCWRTRSPHLPAFSVPMACWRTKFRNKRPGAGLHYRDGALKSSTDIVSPPTHNNKWFSPSSGQHQAKVIWTLGWTSGWLFSYHGDKRAHRDRVCGSRKPRQVEELDKRQAKVPGYKIWGASASQGHAMQLLTPNLHKGKSESCVQGLILRGAGSHPGPALEVHGDSTPPLTSCKHSSHRLKGLPTGYSWEHGRLLRSLIWREELENEHEFCWNTTDTYRLE